MVLILTSKWLVEDIYSLLVAYNRKLLLLIEKDEKNLSSLSFSNLFISDILRTLNSYQLYLLTSGFLSKFLGLLFQLCHLQQLSYESHYIYLKFLESRDFLLLRSIIASESLAQTYPKVSETRRKQNKKNFLNLFFLKPKL